MVISGVTNLMAGATQAVRAYAGSTEVWSPVSRGYIYYKSTNNSVVTPNVSSGFGANIVSNTYSGGQGTITFDGAVTAIPGHAFSGITNLATINIPNTVTTISTQVFSGCTSLTEFVMPDSVTALGTSNFRYCSSLKSVSLSSGLTSIPNYSFTNCTVLTSVTVPSSITDVGTAAFRDCPALPSISLANVSTIGDNVFSGCTSLASVSFSSGLTSLGEFAFRGCSNLSAITLAEGFTTLNAGAFYGCSKISAVTLPSTLTTFGQSAFQNCSALSSVTVSSGITNIGHSGFYNCTAISSVTLPNSVTSISARAFYGCTALTSITIGSGVTSIGDDCFRASQYLNIYYGGLYSQWQNVTLGSNCLYETVAMHYRYNSKTAANNVGSTSFTASTSQFIYLGVPLSLDTVIECEYSGSGINDGTSCWLGCPLSTASTNNFYFKKSSNTGVTYHWCTNTPLQGDIGIRGTSNTRGSFKLENFKITNLNDTSKYREGSRATRIPTTNVALAVDMKKWWIRRITIKKGNTTVVNITPCTCDNVAGFYDSVSNTFMTTSNLRVS